MSPIGLLDSSFKTMPSGKDIAVLQGGEIRQFGPPQEIYDRPADLFVAGFIGSTSMNFIKPQAMEDSGGPGLRSGNEDFVLPLRHAGKALRPWIANTRIVGMRPERISHAATVQRTAHNAYVRKFKIELVEPTGPETLLFIRINCETVCCRVRPEQVCAAGETMELAFALSRAVFFDPESGKRIG